VIAAGGRQRCIVFVLVLVFKGTLLGSYIMSSEHFNLFSGRQYYTYMLSLTPDDGSLEIVSQMYRVAQNKMPHQTICDIFAII